MTSASYRSLAGTVGGGIRCRRKTTQRDHVDEHSAFLPEEDWQNSMCVIDVTEQIDLDHQFMSLDWRVLKPTDRPDANIADPDINGAETQGRLG